MMSDDTVNTTLLKIMSYNMHGFYQGYPTLHDLSDAHCFDVIMLQEHWLTPDNLSTFDHYFTEYFSVGCSAMAKRLESGMLRGRPFGGVITLVHNRFKKFIEIVKCDERFAIIKIGNLTSNRHHLSYDDCLENKGRLQDCSCSIGSYHCIQCYAHIL